ncbi:MAG: Uma2 family endonuclease, partial [Armatimonadota bacterium]|nr:Uma2 family endonuclease [Armatimonadota bacterium]
MPYTHTEFERLAATYPELRMELTAEGDLIIMPPTGGESGRRGFRLIGQLAQYLEENEIGEGFDSSTGFTLPNGAERAPDLAWVERSRWEALTPDVREKFLPLCPDFAVEVLSPTDRLAKTQEKMQEYIANGAR